MTYAATAIKSPFDTRSMKNGGAAALTNKRIVKYTADKTVDVATTSTDKFAGILDQSSGVYYSTQDPLCNAVGQMESVQVGGKAILTAGALVPVGDPITSDSTGRGISAATLIAAGTPTSIIGYAATGASGANVDFEIEIFPSNVYNAAAGTQVVSVADHAALKAVTAAARYAGQVIVTQNDGWSWIFNSTSTAADTTEQLVVAPTAGSGKWLRIGQSIDIKLAIAFGTADAAALFTVPAGFTLEVSRAFWEITTQFAGGTSSAIGISSDTAPYSTKGDILGGASGDLTATLVSTSKYVPGTLGAKYASNGLVYLSAGVAVRFDRIASVYTSGAGFVHLECRVIQ